MQPHLLIPSSLRHRLPKQVKQRIRRASRDAKNSLVFLLNPARQHAEQCELALCSDVEDYLRFGRRCLGVGALQFPREIAAVIARLSEASPQRLCEIGTAHGGTTLLFARTLPTVHTIIGIDVHINHAPQLRAFKQPHQKLHLLRGSSHSSRSVRRVERLLKGEKLDVLFIDGDHRYEAVKEDFLLYRHLVRAGGFILFHDIVPDHNTRFGKPTSCWAGGVPLLWERIKPFYKHEEFVQNGQQNGFGIGLLHYCPNVSLPAELANSQDDASAYPLLVRHKTC